ncbi:MAG: FkbM family methyltransferase [Anaerolineae bacterium]|nr:FkbM family methyltransferase [Anaerolineae bacterium]
MLSFLKSLIERNAALAISLRSYRHLAALQRQQPTLTPYGFYLMGHAAMQSGHFEPEETAVIQNLLDDIAVFIDVGANVGFYTCLARKAGKQTLAIEPLAANLDYLYANLQANGWHDVEVIACGLAQQPGTAVLYGSGTGASLVSGWAGSPVTIRHTIPLSTLDIVLGSRFAGQPLLIKIDVEGVEYDLLQSADSALALQPAPIWLVEIAFREHHPDGLNPHFAATFEIFWQHGYQAVTADTAQSPVTPADVARWLQTRTRDFGGPNYLFTKL